MGFAEPYEGDYMARLGRTAATASDDQPEGRNELSQMFVVDEATEAFVYNMFTFDYTGFDSFRY